MKIFLDTADTKTIGKHFETGLIDGVTTNPQSKYLAHPTALRSVGTCMLKVLELMSH